MRLRSQACREGRKLSKYESYQPPSDPLPPTGKSATRKSLMNISSSFLPAWILSAYPDFPSNPKEQEGPSCSGPSSGPALPPSGQMAMGVIFRALEMEPTALSITFYGFSHLYSPGNGCCHQLGPPGLRSQERPGGHTEHGYGRCPRKDEGHEPISVREKNLFLLRTSCLEGRPNSVLQKSQINS